MMMNKTQTSAATMLFLHALFVLIPFMTTVVVKAISPYPGSYPAITTITNDDVNDNLFYREATSVWTNMVPSHQDPTEETTEGYTIVYDRVSSQYQYALVDDATGDLIPSGVAVMNGVLSPPRSVIPRKHIRRTPEGRALVAMSTSDSGATPMSQTTLPDGTAPTERRLLNKNTSANISVNSDKRVLLSQPSHRLEHIKKYGSWNSQVETLHRHRTLQQADQLNVLVIPLLFANHVTGSPAERWLPTKEQLTTFFNNVGPDADVAPMGSIKDVFDVLSHEHLDVTATVVDWITLSQNESYYAAQKRGYDGTYMEQALVEALDYLENNVNFNFSQFDINTDGLIDGIIFIHSGYGAEFGGVSEDGAYFMDRIWSHTSSIGNGGWTSSTHSVTVQNYPIVSSLYGTRQTIVQSGVIATSQPMVRAPVVAHELSHFLGLDSTTTAGSSLFPMDQPVGSWSLISNGWGFDGDQSCLPLIDPYSLIKLGWLTNIQEAGRDNSGTKLSFSSSAHETNPAVFRINDGFVDTTEFFILEYRKRGSMNWCLPHDEDGGLALWHIDENASAIDGMNEHGVVNLVQADGLDDLKQFYNPGDSGDLFQPVPDGALGGVGPGLSSVENGGQVPNPNTDSYKGYSTGLSLNDVAIDETTGTLSVDIMYVDDTISLSPTISSNPTKMPTFSPTLSPITTESPDATIAPTVALTFAPTEEHVMPERCIEYRQKFFMFDLRTDMSGDEITWELTNAGAGPTLVTAGGPYQPGVVQKIQYGACLDEQQCWVLYIKDKGGNGIDLYQKDPTTGKAAGFKVWFDNDVIEQSLPTLLSDGSYTSPSFSDLGISFGKDCGKDSNGNDKSTNTKQTDLEIFSGDIYDVQVGAFMFDVYAKNTDFGGIDWSYFKPFLNDNLLHISDHVTVDIYWKTGSYQGYETNREAWTKIDRLAGTSGPIIPLGARDRVSVRLDPSAPTSPMGSTTGFYIVTNPPTLMVSNCTQSIGVNDLPSQKWRRYEDVDIKSGLIVHPSFGGADGLDPSFPTAACFNGEIEYKTYDVDPPLDDPRFQCPSEEKMFTLEIELPSDESRATGITWEIEDMSKRTHRIINSPTYTSSDAGMTKSYSYCLPEWACFRFLMKDESGIGAIGHRATYDSSLVSEDYTGSLSVIDGYQEIGGDFGNHCSSLQIQNKDLIISRRGSYRSNGIMFDIKAKNYNELVSFYRLNNLHIGNTITNTIKIYTKNGSYRGYENDPSVWTEVLSTYYQGAGRGAWTNLHKDLSPNAVISGHTTQAIYILLDGEYLLSNNLDGIKSVGDIWKSFSHTDVYAGITCVSPTPFEGCRLGTDPGTIVAGVNVLFKTGTSLMTTASPTSAPIRSPTEPPTELSTGSPTKSPSKLPSTSPSKMPTGLPTTLPTGSPTESPSGSPTDSPTGLPTASPSESPTKLPTGAPTESPSESPTGSSTESPSESPTESPTKPPTVSPSLSPSGSPTEWPSKSPSGSPTTENPTAAPTTKNPTSAPTTKSPTTSPTAQNPTVAPTTKSPIDVPTSSITCASDERLFEIELDATDAPSGEASLTGWSWIVEDISKAETRYFSPTSYGSDATALGYHRHRYCLPHNTCYRFAFEKINDGTSLEPGIVYSAWYDGEVQVDGITTQSTSTVPIIDGADFGSWCDNSDIRKLRGSLNMGFKGHDDTVKSIMFDVRAKPNQHMNIFRYNYWYVAQGNHTISVYTKEGSYVGYENDESAWTHIFNKTLVNDSGGGMYDRTSFSPQAVDVVADTVQALYVVVHSSTKSDGAPLKVTSDGMAYGQQWKSTDHLIAYAGKSCDSSVPFVGCNDDDTGVKPAAPMGVLLYAIIKSVDGATFSPVASPVTAT